MGAWGYIKKGAKSIGRRIEGAGKYLGEVGEDIYMKDTWEDLDGTTAMKDAKKDAKALADQQAAEEAQNLADQYASIEKERKKRARMQGRQSTILAGGDALGGSSLNVMRKTLLGA